MKVSRDAKVFFCHCVIVTVSLCHCVIVSLCHCVIAIVFFLHCVIERRYTRAARVEVLCQLQGMPKSDRGLYVCVFMCVCVCA